MLLILSPKAELGRKADSYDTGLGRLAKSPLMRGGDLNPHALRHRILRRIPSVTASYGRLRQVVNSRFFFVPGYGA
jgi:hypothetical protein